MTTERSIIPIFKAEAYLIPLSKLEPDEVERAHKRFKYFFYQESQCKKCDVLPERHSEVCDSCSAFKGLTQTSKIVEYGKNNRPHLSLPVGAGDKVQKWLEAIGQDDNFEIKKRFQETAEFSRPIKFTVEFDEEHQYQAKAVKVLLKKKRGILESLPRTGKCVEGSTLVMTNNGLAPISSLFENYSLNKKGETLIVSKHISIATSKGTRTVAGLYSKVVDSTFEVKTHHGYSVRGTDNHPMLVVNKQAALEWKSLSKVTTEDYLVISRRPQWLGSGNSLFASKKDYRKVSDYNDLQETPEVLSKELARLLGYWVANGSLSIKGRLTFSSNNVRASKDFIKCVTAVFPKLKAYFVKQDQKSGGVICHSLQVYRWLQDACNLTMGVAKEKSIPSVLLNCDKEFFIEFLSAYTTCDAGIGSKSIGYCSASKLLVDQLHVALTYLGIVARKKSRMNCATNGTKIKRPYYFLSLHKNEADKLLELLELKKPFVRTKNTFKDQHDVLPHAWSAILGVVNEKFKLNPHCWIKDRKKYSVRSVGNLVINIQKGINRKVPMNRADLANVNMEVLEWLEPEAARKLEVLSNPDLYFTKVTSVLKINKPVRVYDVEVPKGHHFIANGLVSHNTVMAVAVMCEVGKKALVLGSQKEWLDQFRDTFLGSPNQMKFTNAKARQIVRCATLADILKADVALCTFSMFMSDKGKKVLEQIRHLFEVIVIDECHGVPAKQTSKILARFSAPYFIGLSGTVERKQTEEIRIAHDLIGPILHTCKVKRMRPHLKVLFPKVTIADPKGGGQAAFVNFDSRLESNTSRRNVILKEAIKLARQGHLVMIPLKRVQTILKWTQEINAEVERPGFALPYYGTLSKDRRKEFIDKAKDYECRILVGNIALLSTGLNIPRASCIFEVSMTSNLPKAKQRMARILTPMPGKPTPLIVYVLDDSDLMRKVRRNEFWNCVMPEFSPVIARDDMSAIMAYFANKESGQSVDLRKGF